jgi:hypothetical protein
MKVKVKKLGKEEFKVIIKTEKGSGELFVRKCLKCNNPFVSGKVWELMCDECIRKMDEEVKEMFNEFQHLFTRTPFKPCSTKDFDTSKTKKTQVNRKPIKKEDNNIPNSDLFLNKQSKKFYGALNYAVNNPAKIRVPKYEEKWAFVKKAKPICCVNKNIGLKIMELIARGKSLKQVAELFNIKESSTWTYYNDLRNAGLIINTSQGWMINPAIEYELL